jgi:hypothetical protein
VVGAFPEARSTATTLGAKIKTKLAREVWSMPVDVSLADSLSFERRAVADLVMGANRSGIEGRTRERKAVPPKRAEVEKASLPLDGDVRQGAVFSGWPLFSN